MVLRGVDSTCFFSGPPRQSESATALTIQGWTNNLSQPNYVTVWREVIPTTTRIVDRALTEWSTLCLAVEPILGTVRNPSQCDHAIGVDVGMKFIAVTSDTANKTLFYGGGRMKYTRWKYYKLRQALQSRGTRSAKRKLTTMSGRERRFVTDSTHCISKKIVRHARTKCKHPVIVLEDLKGIRNTAKSNSKTGKRNLNNWSFYQLQQFIEYKAAELEIPMVYILHTILLSNVRCVDIPRKLIVRKTFIGSNVKSAIIRPMMTEQLV